MRQCKMANGIKGSLQRDLAKSGVNRKVFNKGSVAETFSELRLPLSYESPLKFPSATLYNCWQLTNAIGNNAHRSGCGFFQHYERPCRQRHRKLIWKMLPKKQ
jgi:hypothetical protein